MNRKSSQEWLSLVENWQGSNLPQREFCKQHKLSLSAFQYWLGKVRKGSITGEGGGKASGFVSVSIKGTGKLPNAQSVLLELVLPDGRRVNFYEGIDVQFLRTLLS